MASFTAIPPRPFLSVELSFHGGCEMNGLFQVCGNLLMTRLAGVRTHVQRWICWARICFGLVRRLALWCGIIFVARMSKRNYQRQNQHRQKTTNGESLPIFHITPLALGGQFPGSTRIRLLPPSLEGHDNLDD